jgi:hypothetical protein
MENRVAVAETARFLALAQVLFDGLNSKLSFKSSGFGLEAVAQQCGKAAHVQVHMCRRACRIPAGRQCTAIT